MSKFGEITKNYPDMEHAWWVKTAIFPLFGKGKSLDIRVWDKWVKEIKVGDILFINSQIRRTVTAIRTYDSFQSMLENEDSQKIAPGYAKEKIFDILRQLYPVLKSKVVVFELAPI